MPIYEEDMRLPPLKITLIFINMSYLVPTSIYFNNKSKAMFSKGQTIIFYIVKNLTINLLHTFYCIKDSGVSDVD